MELIRKEKRDNGVVYFVDSLEKLSDIKIKFNQAGKYTSSR